MRRITVSIAAFALGVGCSESTSGTCDASSIEAHFVGSLTKSNQQTPLDLTGTQTNQTLESPDFTFLVEVLGYGNPTGSRSAVWTMGSQGTTDAVLLIQLGGERSVGATLPIIGSITTGLPWGEGPAISAIFQNGLLILFSLDDFDASEANGTLTIQSVAPLRGFLDATMGSAGVSAHLEGQISVKLAGSGC